MNLLAKVPLKTGNKWAAWIVASLVLIAIGWAAAMTWTKAVCFIPV